MIITLANNLQLESSFEFYVEELKNYSPKDVYGLYFDNFTYLVYNEEIGSLGISDIKIKTPLTFFKYENVANNQISHNYSYNNSLVEALTINFNNNSSFYYGGNKTLEKVFFDNINFDQKYSVTTDQTTFNKNAETPDPGEYVKNYQTFSFVKDLANYPALFSYVYDTNVVDIGVSYAINPNNISDPTNDDLLRRNHAYQYGANFKYNDSLNIYYIKTEEDTTNSDGNDTKYNSETYLVNYSISSFEFYIGQIKGDTVNSAPNFNNFFSNDSDFLNTRARNTDRKDIGIKLNITDKISSQYIYSSYEATHGVNAFNNVDNETHNLIAEYKLNDSLSSFINYTIGQTLLDIDSGTDQKTLKLGFTLN